MPASARGSLGPAAALPRGAQQRPAWPPCSSCFALPLSHSHTIAGTCAVKPRSLLQPRCVLLQRQQQPRGEKHRVQLMRCCCLAVCPHRLRPRAVGSAVSPDIASSPSERDAAPRSPRQHVERATPLADRGVAPTLVAAAGARHAGAAHQCVPHPALGASGGVGAGGAVAHSCRALQGSGGRSGWGAARHASSGRSAVGSG